METTEEKLKALRLEYRRLEREAVRLREVNAALVKALQGCVAWAELNSEGDDLPIEFETARDALTLAKGVP